MLCCLSVGVQWRWFGSIVTLPSLVLLLLLPVPLLAVLALPLPSVAPFLLFLCHCHLPACLPSSQPPLLLSFLAVSVSLSCKLPASPGCKPPPRFVTCRHTFTFIHCACHTHRRCAGLRLPLPACSDLLLRGHRARLLKPLASRTAAVPRPSPPPPLPTSPPLTKTYMPMGSAWYASANAVPYGVANGSGVAPIAGRAYKLLRRLCVPSARSSPPASGRRLGTLLLLWQACVLLLPCIYILSSYFLCALLGICVLASRYLVERRTWWSALLQASPTCHSTHHPHRTGAFSLLPGTWGICLFLFHLGTSCPLHGRCHGSRMLWFCLTSLRAAASCLLLMPNLTLTVATPVMGIAV